MKYTLAYYKESLITVQTECNAFINLIVIKMQMDYILNAY